MAPRHHLLLALFGSSPVAFSGGRWVDVAAPVLLDDLSCCGLHLLLVELVILVYRLYHVTIYELQVLQHLDGIVECGIDLTLTLSLDFELVQVADGVLLEGITGVDEGEEALFRLVSC